MDCSKQNLQKTLKSGFGFLLLPFMWWLIADWQQIVTPLLLPSLESVLTRNFELLISGSLRIDFQSTLWRWLAGFILGTTSGVLTGLAFGLSHTSRRLFEFPIEFMRAMPVTAIFPLYLILFGIGDASKIAMACTPTFLCMLINTAYGVSMAEPLRRNMARIYGAGKIQVLRHIIIYEALPQIFIGLRVSLSLSLVVTVVAEMFIGTDFGLGQRVYDSYLTNSVTTLYALLLILGLLGYAVNKFFLSIERRLVFWVQHDCL